MAGEQGADEMSAGAANAQVLFADVRQGGRPVRLEYRWVGAEGRSAPLLVFLHEGLGSASMWKDFPAQLCAAGGYRGLVYSRTGYGRSTPRPHGERWTPEYMHEQAREVLPQFLCAAGVDVATDPPWLFGHSDGASIALIHAAACPDAVAGLILLAPHIFVEDLSVQSIEQAKYAYAGTDLRSRLARHHADVDSAFWGWNDIWLDPAFRRWNIEGLLASIRVPVLAVQGHNDEYGTMAQVDGLAARVPQAEVLKLDDCAHSPHRDRPEAVIQASIDFIGRQRQWRSRSNQRHSERRHHETS
jgi:pimeloyl-ACP methyl ester carboxylesterase